MGPKTSIVLLFLASLAMGLMRYDFSPTGGHHAVQLNFWNGFTGPDGRVMLEIIRQFNKANPDVQVSMQRMDWPTYYNKLMVSAVDGRGPEVFVVHASTLARMNRAGFISAVDEEYDDGGIPRNDFDPQLLEQVNYSGHLIGVPLDVHPQGLYCNAELLRAAGIVNGDGSARPPTNREEFLKAARAAKIGVDRDGNPQSWGFAFTMWRENFMSLVPQFGGRYFDPDGRCALDCPGNIAALQFLSSLLLEDKLVPEPENGLGWVGFRQKKVAMVFAGVFMLGDLQRLDNLQYIAAPLPQIGPFPGTLADSHVLCLRAGLEEKKRSAGLRFVRFLSDHSLQWAMAGQVPARKSVRARPEFRALPVQSAFARQVPVVMFPPRTPALFELTNELDVAVEKSFRGRETPAQALHEANQHLQAFLDQEQAETSAGAAAGRSP